MNKEISIWHMEGEQKWLELANINCKKEKPEDAQKRVKKRKPRNSQPKSGNDINSIITANRGLRRRSLELAHRGSEIDSLIYLIMKFVHNVQHEHENTADRRPKKRSLKTGEALKQFILYYMDSKSEFNRLSASALTLNARFRSLRVWRNFLEELR